MADFEDEGWGPQAKEYGQPLKAENNPWLSTRKEMWTSVLQLQGTESCWDPNGPRCGFIPISRKDYIPVNILIPALWISWAETQLSSPDSWHTETMR